jgi:hypothetical protein
MAGANSGAIRAGKAFVEFTLSDKKLAGQLRALQSKFNAIGATFTRVGGIATAAGSAIVGAFTGAAKSFASAGSTLTDMAARTGLSVEQLGELGYVASQTGSSLEAVESSAGAMAKFIHAVDTQSQAATDTLRELGLAVDDVVGKPPGQQWEILAAALAGIGDPTKRAALAMKVFGRGGRELLPMLADGAEAMKIAREEARRLGLVMSEGDAKAADELGDAWDKLWAQLARVVQVIGAAVAGEFTALLKATQPIIKAVIDWIIANGELLRTVLIAGVAIAGIGAVLVEIGLAFHFIGLAAAGLAGAISAVGAALGAVLSPMGLVVAAVAGGTGAFLQMNETGRALVANLSAWFGQLATTATASFGAIAAALGAGDIAAAGEVLWASLKLLWLEGTESLRNFWSEYKLFFLKNTTEMVFEAQRLWATMVAKIKEVWIAYESFFKSSWANLQHSATEAVLKIQKAIMEYLTGEPFDISVELNVADADNAVRQAEINAQERAANSANTAERDGALAGVDAASAIATQERNRTFNSETAELRKALDEARQAWKQSTDAANAAAEAAKAQAATVGESLTAASLDAAANTSASRGTFNGLATLALEAQGGDAAEQTAKNTALAARILGRVESKLGVGGLVVGG